jgi:hypothetical protein
MSEEINPKKEAVETPAAVDEESNDSNSKRGPYHQYEDPQTMIEKIRAYRRQRYPDSEIMKMLDNMPRRTYYNYVKKMQEQDREAVEQWMQEYTEQVAEEFFNFRENACHMLRRLQAIIDDEKTPNKERLKAMEQYFNLTERLATFSSAGRGAIISAMHTRNKQIREEQEREYWRKRSADSSARIKEETTVN